MWTGLTSQLLSRGGRCRAFLLGFLLGLSVVLAALAEQRALTLSQRIAPLLHPAGITALDWRLAQVKLREVEERIDKLTDASSPDGHCCASYWYDPNRNKVMARLRYGSDTANLLSVQELKRRLGQAGQTTADRVEAELQVEDGIKLKAGDVEVEFATPLPEWRVFAVYSNGQLELTDRELK